MFPAGDARPATTQLTRETAPQGGAVVEPRRDGRLPSRSAVTDCRLAAQSERSMPHPRRSDEHSRDPVRTAGVLAATCLSTLVGNANTAAVSILLPAISEYTGYSLVGASVIITSDSLGMCSAGNGCSNSAWCCSPRPAG